MSRLAFGALIVCSLASAEPLTVERAVELAVKQSPALKALVARQREALAQGAVDTQLENPQLRVGSFRSDRLISPAVTGQRYSDTPFGGLNVGVRWSPPNPMVSSARHEEARQLAEAVGADLEGQRREVIARVRSLHATARSFERQLVLSRTAVELRSQLATLSRQRVAAQAARGVDQGLADLDELEARASLLELEQRRRTSQRELSGMLGLPPGTPLELVGADRPCEPPKEDAATLLAQATQNDPKLEARRAKLQALAAERSRARLALIPWIDFVQVGYVLQNDESPAYGSLRLGITLPLFNWNGNKVDVLDARRDRVDAEYEGDRTLLLQQLDQALADARDDAQLVARYREAAPRVIDQRVDQLERSLEAGETSLVDFAVVQARSLSAQRAGVKAELHCQLSLIALDQLVGR